jgi:hypothetical protein
MRPARNDQQLHSTAPERPKTCFDAPNDELLTLVIPGLRAAQNPESSF